MCEIIQQKIARNTGVFLEFCYQGFKMTLHHCLGHVSIKSSLYIFRNFIVTTSNLADAIKELENKERFAAYHSKKFYAHIFRA